MEAMVISCKYIVRLKYSWSQKRIRSTAKMAIKQYLEKKSNQSKQVSMRGRLI